LGMRRQAVKLDRGFDRRENAISFPFSFSSALDMKLAGLKAFGYDTEARSFLLNRALRMPDGVHELERYWHLACAFLGENHPVPEKIGLKTSESARIRVLERMANLGLMPHSFIVLCPFAGGTYENLEKRWAGFSELADLLVQRGHTLLVCPGPDEVQQALTLHPSILVLTDVSLGEYAALLQFSRLMISNDTGPGHLAAAVDCPLVSVLGPTIPAQWRAWGPSVHMVQGEGYTWPSVVDVMAACSRVSS
jgi:heptosyltransferase-2